ncbi:MAG: alpha/beta hydrolase family protein [Chitinophagales bacterium]
MPKLKFSALFIAIFTTFSLFAQEEWNFLLNYEKLTTVEVEELQERWKKNHVPELMIPINYTVEGYNVQYRTKWHDGTEIMASGVYWVPKDIDVKIPLMVYNHGTVVRPDRNLGFNGEENICIGFATDGYGVLFPDYIGLGQGDSTHLYQHADSEAQAGVDMLRAIRELNKELDLVWNQELYITGYSQGGHSTLALHRKLQQEYSTEFKVTASSPMSGAYDMAGAQSVVMFQPYTQPFYLPYLLKSYNEIYDIFPEDEFLDIYNEPYDSLIPLYFEGNHGIGDINAMMPEIPADVIKEDFVNEFKSNPEFPFLVHLKENEVYDWKPEAPVQFCYCESDEEVFYQNTLVAYDKMKENGAEDIVKRMVGKNQTHGQCAIFTSMQTKFFFDSIRAGDENGNKGPIFKRLLLSLAKTQVNNKPDKKKKKK